MAVALQDAVASTLLTAAAPHPSPNWQRCYLRMPPGIAGPAALPHPLLPPIALPEPEFTSFCSSPRGMEQQLMGQTHRGL